MDSNKIGLALSGGGYRAAAFHLGTLKKLHQLGLLDKLFALSTISGGSIAGAYYLLNKDNFDEFARGLESALQISAAWKIILSPRFLITSFILLAIIGLIFYCMNIICAFSWLKLAAFLFFIVLIAIMIFSFLHNIISLSDLAEKAYKKIFFGDKKLCELPEKPLAAINATNLDTGRQFTFSKHRMYDSNYEHPEDKGPPIFFNVLDFPVSVAVSASSAFPPILNPIKVHKKYFADPKNYHGRANPTLVDGGVYDNQGIHKITEKSSEFRCDYVIVSDASYPFEPKFSQSNPWHIFKRVNSAMMLRIKNLQTVQNVYYNETGLVKEIAYFSIDWKYEICLRSFVENLRKGNVRRSVIDGLGIPADYYNDPNNFKATEVYQHIKSRINYDEIIRNGISEVEIDQISQIRTRLWALTKNEIDLLSRHASTLTEILVKLYCPSILAQP